MEELIEILESIRPDVDFESEAYLINDSVLDSFDIISIVGALNDAYDIEIQPADLIPDNFNSAKAILALVNRLQED